jgi:hypothetical protein
MAAKKKNFKAMRGAARAIDKGLDLGTTTKTRIQMAVDLIAKGTYSTADLADDMLGQSADFLGALAGFGGAAAEAPTLRLVTNGAAPSGVVWFRQPVDVTQIDKLELVGPITQQAASKVITVHSIAVNQYALLEPDAGAALPAAGDIDGVKVSVTAVPGQLGVYRGFLTLQSTDVLAEIVVVRK